MPSAIIALFSSKKFWLTILGGAVSAGLTYAGAPTSLITTIASLFGANIVGQGIADHGALK